MRRLNLSKFSKGFTLIELLIVIAIIAILSVGVYVALNPAARFADARNARRYSDVNSILTAVQEYIVDNDGSIPAGVTSTEKQLGTCADTDTGADSCGAAAACLDLSTTLADYLKSIPRDPSLASSANYTKYSAKSVNGIVTVRACGAESGSVIEVSR